MNGYLKKASSMALAVAIFTAPTVASAETGAVSLIGVPSPGKTLTPSQQQDTGNALMALGGVMSLVNPAAGIASAALGGVIFLTGLANSSGKPT